MESLYELWGKRNPQWEKRYQDSILEVFSDYGKGVNKYQDARGKIFGAGYVYLGVLHWLILQSNKATY